MTISLAGIDFNQIEQELSHVLNGLLKKIMGKGSANTEIHLVSGMILVKATGVLTVQDKFLLESKGDGADIIEQYRCQALRAGKKYIISELNRNFERINVEDIYYVIDVERDTAVIVLI